MRKLQDPIYLQQIKQQFEKKNYPTQTINLRVAELISFFTSSYYSSKEADPTKVFQYNLSELSKKTREMYFIDTALDERGLFSFKIP